MATSIFTRIPWRTVSKLGVSANPVFSNAFRTPQRAIAPLTSQSVRHMSNTPNAPNPASTETTSITPPAAEPTAEDIFDVRYPRNVQAIYLRPLRREAEYGVPSCDLQLRSYNIRNLEFFSDFALRAAYYLHLPAFGPVPLPKMIERWTVPRSHFIHKKSQENFERKTLRRLIQIKDGHPETVALWLAFLRKHAYYGIGMKANVWEYAKIGVGKDMDASMEEMREVMAPQWELFGRRQGNETSDKVMEILNRESFKAAVGGSAPGVRVEPHAQESPTPAAPPEREVTNSARCPPKPQPHLSTTPKHETRPTSSNIFRHPTHGNPTSRELSRSAQELVPQKKGELSRAKKETLATLLAMELDPERCSCAFGVDVDIELYVFDGSKLSLEDDASPLDGGKKSPIKLGLFSYPVLQAADILVHGANSIPPRATHVPVGEDQAQHLEFARECVTNFNHAHRHCLIAPETILSPTKRIMSLTTPTQKMSKSHPSPLSRILLTDSPETVSKKITSAQTDSRHSISYSPTERPGVTNLLTLWSSFDTQFPKRNPSQIAAECALKGLTLRDVKREVAEVVNKGLEGISKGYERVLGDEGYVEEVARKGGIKARENAEETMVKVREAVGF
ncbi:tryptophanyl-tRNA synthetase-like protein [Sclerotinia borealis F-4128]|uniref:Small ribosomal subunit protein uS10m n=1 Tax=Sclerotinia borealis (strain F-4128) TaxID=1432307 RepID=W9CXR2_SCLBF|nr:tryptophanyl-tRNA synthetase-like protein [Sclerotinia borealis F-4128]